MYINSLFLIYLLAGGKFSQKIIASYYDGFVPRFDGRFYPQSTYDGEYFGQYGGKLGGALGSSDYVHGG